jgi:GNAT superfamily N-acetyltransferase
LEGVAVAAKWRGRGVGTQMLGDFEDKARQAGYSCVQLGTTDGAASRFYLQRGYRLAADTWQAQPVEHIVLSKRIVPRTPKNL